MLLSDVLGSEVRSVDGTVVGRLVDLVVEVGEAHPTVRGVALGRRRRIRALVAWDRVASFEHDDVRLSLSRAEVAALGFDGRLSERELLLARDVLDTQIVDVVGKRLARVSEVVLTRDGATVRVAAVEAGAAGVWRRLGLRRLAERAPDRAVDWADLHLTSARGHALQLAIPTAAVHQLGAAELASVVANLPTAKAAAVLDAVAPAVAAGALSASHPRVGARLLHAVSGPTASSVVAHMPVDDATALLRGLPLDAVERLLGDVVSERAATLRRLLAHPADTAGGLMNTAVRRAEVGDSVETIRGRAAADAPELEALATVFVVDADGRPVGCFAPSDLLAGRDTPRRVPAIPVTLPVERLIDLFALHDYLALPVVDADGRLVGVVAVDDVLEELLAERLPGQGRYARIRRARSRRAPRRPGPTAGR